MNLENYKKIWGFDSPKEKYNFIKRDLNKKPIRSFVFGLYPELRKYYVAETEDIIYD